MNAVLPAAGLPPVSRLRRGSELRKLSVPPELAATAPPEVRGLSRDGVRLLVTCSECGEIQHRHFGALPDYLGTGDLIVVNYSRTLPAALMGTRSDGTVVGVHLSGHISDCRCVIELRHVSDRADGPFLTAEPGDLIALPGQQFVRLECPYYGENSARACRLWWGSVTFGDAWLAYLEQYGSPIRYSYSRKWPLHFYQTIFGRKPGSAEMPSAGRPFSRRVLEMLASKGVEVVGILLHTGFSSPEWDEGPQIEFFDVPAATAIRINQTLGAGRHVVAVGTTVVRALESATAPDGVLRAASGWTDLVVGPERGVRTADCILTGLHEPVSTHLSLISAFIQPSLLERGYREAIRQGYLWHEFGDSHVIVPHAICHTKK